MKAQSEKLKEKVKQLYAIGARHSQTSQQLGKKLVQEKQKHSKTRKDKEELEQRLKLLECNLTVDNEGAAPKPEDCKGRNLVSALKDEDFRPMDPPPQTGLKRSREDRDPPFQKKASSILPSGDVFESPKDQQPLASSKEKPSASSSAPLRSKTPPTSMPSSVGLDQSSIDCYFKASEKPKEKRKSGPSDLKLRIHEFGPIKSLNDRKQDQTKARPVQQIEAPGYLSPREPGTTLKHADSEFAGEKQGSPLKGKNTGSDSEEPQEKENFPPPTKVSVYGKHKPTSVKDGSKTQRDDQEETRDLSSHSHEESNDQGAVRNPFLPKQYVEVVRKKAERAKLPGRVCEQCQKYYTIMNQWGFGSQQEIANRCSRYSFIRDKPNFLEKYRVRFIFRNK